MGVKQTVGVLGGGVFGLNVALELSPYFDVEVIEAQSELLRGATYANHNRHHFGFHYPRSRETAAQCLESQSDFVSQYSEALRWDFDNYYCIGSRGSKVTPDQYLAFCEEMGLQYESVCPPGDLLDPGAVDLCLKVNEPICDYQILRTKILSRLSESSVRLLTSTRIVGGSRQAEGRKSIRLESGTTRFSRDYDYVVNAMYANSNLFCEWFDFPKRLFQFNLQELNLIHIPRDRAFGVTIMDGIYPSILPYGRTGLYIMAHVEASQLVRESSHESRPLLSRLASIESNWENVRKISEPLLPILKKADYRRSLFVDRVVDAGRFQDDARVTEITSHGDGCWTVFAAKIITSVSTSRKLAERIREQAK